MKTHKLHNLAGILLIPWHAGDAITFVQAKAESAAACAVAAAGMLQSIGGTASKAQYWRSYYGAALPYMITVLAIIIPMQPQLASKACPSPVFSFNGIAG